MREMRWFGVVLAILVAGSARAASPWDNLKAGMSSGDVRAQLGEPLLRSAGRGFEIWIYDARTEVVWLRGAVIAWTPPGGRAMGVGSQIDLAGVVEQAKPKPAPPAYVPRAEINAGYERVRVRPRRWQSF